MFPTIYFYTFFTCYSLPAMSFLSFLPGKSLFTLQLSFSYASSRKPSLIFFWNKVNNFPSLYCHCTFSLSLSFCLLFCFFSCFSSCSPSLYLIYHPSISMYLTSPYRLCRKDGGHVLFISASSVLPHIMLYVKYTGYSINVY